MESLAIFQRGSRLAALFLMAGLAASCRTPQPGPEAVTPSPPPQPGSLVMTDQGAGWTDAERKDFYSRDQGSRLIPLRWMMALKTKDGGPFMADSLARYGYLPNQWSIPAGLPVGFTVSGGSDGQTLGMTCSACHTRQIQVNQVS